MSSAQQQQQRQQFFSIKTTFRKRWWRQRQTILRGMAVLLLINICLHLRIHQQISNTDSVRQQQIHANDDTTIVRGQPNEPFFASLHRDHDKRKEGQDETTTTTTTSLSLYNSSNSSSSNNNNNEYTARNDNITLPTNDDGSLCLTFDCIDQVARQIARPFPRVPKRVWCPPLEGINYTSNDLNSTGLLMVKVPKAASSTTAGVALRIQDLNRIDKEKVCRIRYNHGLASDYYAPQNPSTGRSVHQRQSFLWTSIRDPAKRALSRYYFTHVSFKGANTTDEAVLEAMNNPHPKFGMTSSGQGGFQTRYVSLVNLTRMSAWQKEQPDRVYQPERLVRVIQDIVESYDFLVLVERMDDSLVLLSMILDVPIDQVLVSSGSKVAGKNYFLRFQRCFQLIKSRMTPRLENYFASDRWIASNYGDYLLHRTIHHCLDLTVKALGKRTFRRRMSRYRELKELEKKYCADAPVYPCSDTGVPQDRRSKWSCYDEDFGCGYHCMDNMVRKRRHGKLG